MNGGEWFSKQRAARRIGVFSAAIQAELRAGRTPTKKMVKSMVMRDDALKNLDNLHAIPETNTPIRSLKFNCTNARKS